MTLGPPLAEELVSVIVPFLLLPTDTFPKSTLEVFSVRLALVVLAVLAGSGRSSAARNAHQRGQQHYDRTQPVLSDLLSCFPSHSYYLDQTPDFARAREAMPVWKVSAILP